MAGYVNMERVRPGEGPVHRSHRVVRMSTPISDGLTAARVGEHLSVDKRSAGRLVKSGQATDATPDGDAG